MCTQFFEGFHVKKEVIDVDNDMRLKGIWCEVVIRVKISEKRVYSKVLLNTPGDCWVSSATGIFSQIEGLSVFSKTLFRDVNHHYLA